MPNVTVAMNAIVRSLALEPGDEVLSTDHEYGAVVRTWEYYCERRGARFIAPADSLAGDDRRRVRRATLGGRDAAHEGDHPQPHHLGDGADLPAGKAMPPRPRGRDPHGDRWRARAGSDRSEPRRARSRFLHGQLPQVALRTQEEGQSSSSPGPSGRRCWIPLVIAGAGKAASGGSTFVDHFEWTGTDDPSSYLSVPAAIAFQREHNWCAIRAACHALARDARERMAALTGLPQIAPDSTDWWMQMCDIPFPRPIRAC